jgi:hypothetical protein
VGRISLHLKECVAYSGYDSSAWMIAADIGKDCGDSKSHKFARVGGEHFMRLSVM